MWVVQRIPKEEAAEKVNPGVTKFPTDPAEDGTHDLSITSSAL